MLLFDDNTRNLSLFPKEKCEDHQWRMDSELKWVPCIPSLTCYRQQSYRKSFQQIDVRLLNKQLETIGINAFLNWFFTHTLNCDAVKLYGDLLPHILISTWSKERLNAEISFLIVGYVAFFLNVYHVYVVVV